MIEDFSFVYILITLGVIACLIFPKNRTLLLAVSIFMAFIAICRGMFVGSDYEHYIEIFKTAADLGYADKYDDQVEIGFVATILLCKYLNIGHVAYYGLAYLAFFIGIWRYATFKGVNKSVVLFFMFFLGYYFMSFNILRQLLAIGIILNFFPLLDKGKYFKFAIAVVIVSILFHKTSVMYLLLIPVHIYSSKAESINKPFLAVILLVSYILFYVGRTYVYDSLTVIFNFLRITDRFGAYVSNGMLREDFGNITSTAYTVFALLLIICKSPKRCIFETNAVVLSYALFNIGNILMGQGIRIFLDFNVIVLILLSDMFYDKQTLFKRVFISASVIMCLTLFTVQFITGNAQEVKPYYFYFEKNE